MPRPFMHWSPEMDEALHVGRREGKSIKELADIIGVADTTVGKRVKALGLPPLRPWAKKRAEGYHRV